MALFIIVLESVILRLCIKEVNYLTTLWRSLLINGASNIVGVGLGVLVLGPTQDSDLACGWWLLLPPVFFIVTLPIEIPLLRYLYRETDISWIRACWFGFGINFISYVALMTCAFLVIFLFPGVLTINP